MAQKASITEAVAKGYDKTFRIFKIRDEQLAKHGMTMANWRRSEEGLEFEISYPHSNSPILSSDTEDKIKDVMPEAMAKAFMESIYHQVTEAVLIAAMFGK